MSSTNIIMEIDAICAKVDLRELTPDEAVAQAKKVLKENLPTSLRVIIKTSIEEHIYVLNNGDDLEIIPKGTERPDLRMTYKNNTLTIKNDILLEKEANNP